MAKVRHDYSGVRSSESRIARSPGTIGGDNETKGKTQSNDGTHINQKPELRPAFAFLARDDYLITVVQRFNPSGIGLCQVDSLGSPASECPHVLSLALRLEPGAIRTIRYNLEYALWRWSLIGLRLH